MDNGPGDPKRTKDDLPISLGLRLMQDRIAMERYITLPESEKKRIHAYVEGSTAGEDAQRRVTRTLKSLHDGVPLLYVERMPNAESKNSMSKA